MCFSPALVPHRNRYPPQTVAIPTAVSKKIFNPAYLTTITAKK
jgi:hypothetical protein